MIRTLHKLDDEEHITTTELSYSVQSEDIDDEKEEKEDAEEWARKVKYLLTSFLCSSAYMFLSYFFPILANLPVMSWIGLPGVTMFSWTITPSLSYVGQGMIMGPKTGLSMLLGALFGWGLLAPIARNKGTFTLSFYAAKLTPHSGWAPGPVEDWKSGAKGWIMWVSLAIMLGESISSLTIVGY